MFLETRHPLELLEVDRFDFLFKRQVPPVYASLTHESSNRWARFSAMQQCCKLHIASLKAMFRVLPPVLSCGNMLCEIRVLLCATCCHNLRHSCSFPTLTILLPFWFVITSLIFSSLVNCYFEVSYLLYATRLGKQLSLTLPM